MKKLEELIEIKFVNFNYSAAIEEYILKKIYKHENEASHINLVKVSLSSQCQNKNRTYQVCIEVDLKNSGFIIKKSNNDIYALIDEISDTFRKKLVKFIDVNTDHKVSPKIVEELPITEGRRFADSGATVFNDLDINKYVILEEKSFNDHTPMHIEEAIDLMELIGRQCILFKNISTGKYSVIYKINEGAKEGYGIINSKM